MEQINTMSDDVFMSYVETKGFYTAPFKVGDKVITRGFKEGDIHQRGMSGNKRDLGLVTDMIQSCLNKDVFVITEISKDEGNTIITLNGGYIYYPEYLKLV